MNIEACIFDLDGVIVDTAKFHFKAWKRLAEQLSVSFDEKDNEALKGVSRMGSLKYILDKGGIQKSEAEMKSLAALKNEWYLENVSSLYREEMLEGVLAFLEDLKRNSIRIGLGSASKNARMILNKLNIENYFEVIVDGTIVVNGKPHPETFLKGAEQLKVNPSHTIVFEDAQKGIAAANAGGFISIGIGAENDLKNARHVMPGFKDFSLEKLNKILGK